MNRRKIILATLQGEETNMVPNQTIFENINALNKFVPHFNEDWCENTLKRLEFLDNFIVEVGYSGLHESKWLCETDEAERVTSWRSASGGGVIKTNTVEETSEHVVIEFETGGKWKIRKNPFWREYISYPIKEKEDLEKLEMPDPTDPKRYIGVKNIIRFFKKKGYFTSAEVNGFFSGVWYRYYNFEDFFSNMVLDKKFTKRLIDLIGEFNLASAQEFLKRGVDSIQFPDDLGFNSGLFFSPTLYQHYFYSWHKRMADFCHQYGAYCHMHSHGNINEILPLIVEAGIDILDPLGPSDNIDLREVKKKYGDKITLFGGISKYIGKMDKQEIDNHLREVVKINRKGGRFILGSEGGIPSDMNEDRFKFYMEKSKKHRTSKFNL